jgi:hypothetical protein
MNKTLLLALVVGIAFAQLPADENNIELVPFNPCLGFTDDSTGGLPKFATIECHNTKDAFEKNSGGYIDTSGVLESPTAC